MAVFLDWKTLDKNQIVSLELENDLENIRRKFEEYMKINYDDERKRDIAIDFHVYNYIFCKDQAFDGRRTSTFMSIMSEILHCDSTTYSPAHTRLRSFQNFQNLILKHSIERSPVSIQVFNENEVGAIIKYAVNSYYRQYNLYKYVFSSKMRVIINQSLPHEIQQPSFPILALNVGFEVRHSQGFDSESAEFASPDILTPRVT